MKTDRYRWMVLPVVLLMLAGAGLPAAPAQEQEPITNEQADQILKELQQIRKLLERMERTNASPQPARATPPRRPARSAVVKVSTDGGYAMGSEDAPVTLVEFTDYQCPFCSRFHQTTFEQLKKAYIDTGKVRFVSRDLPLSFHPQALPAAHAARCAGEQGKYWEMRHELISNFNKLSSEKFEQLAQELGLEVDSFQTCVKAERCGDKIQQDIDEAHSVSITGTPTFVLGKTTTGEFEGFRMVGAQAFRAFEARIKEILAKPEE